MKAKVSVNPVSRRRARAAAGAAVCPQMHGECPQKPTFAYKSLRAMGGGGGRHRRRYAGAAQTTAPAAASASISA
jgi:hypothetical protein